MPKVVPASATNSIEDQAESSITKDITDVMKCGIPVQKIVTRFDGSGAAFKEVGYDFNLGVALGEVAESVYYRPFPLPGETEEDLKRIGKQKEQFMPIDTFNKNLAKKGLRLVKYLTNHDTDTEALIVEADPTKDDDLIKPFKHGDVILAFRGTETLTDALTDLNIALTSLPGKARKTWWKVWEWFTTPKVHSGFNKAYKSVADQIHAVLGPMLKNGSHKRLMVCGHSLGGGISVVASYYLHHMYVKPYPGNSMKLYTYGCPRAGNKPFCQIMAANVPDHFRHVNDADVITRIPPGPIYVHCGTLAFLDDDGIHLDPSIMAMFKEGLSNMVDMMANFSMDILADHKLANYIGKINECRILENRHNLFNVINKVNALEEEVADLKKQLGLHSGSRLLDLEGQSLPATSPSGQVSYIA